MKTNTIINHLLTLIITLTFCAANSFANSPDVSKSVSIKIEQEQSTSQSLSATFLGVNDQLQDDNNSGFYKSKAWDCREVLIVCVVGEDGKVISQSKYYDPLMRRVKYTDSQNLSRDVKILEEERILNLNISLESAHTVKVYQNNVNESNKILDFEL